MGLYRNDQNSIAPELDKNGSLIFKNLNVPIGLAIPILITALHNLFETAEIFQHLNLLAEYKELGTSYALKIASIFLMVWFCFARANWQLLAVILLSSLATLGWLTSHEEMTNYQYTSNTLILKRYDIFEYIGSINLIPRFLEKFYLGNSSVSAIKIYSIATECASVALMIYAIILKKKFLDKNNL